MRLIDCYAELLAYAACLTGESPGNEIPYDEARARFDELCGRAEALKSREKFPEEQWKRGLFAVCALIDETILCSDWPGRNSWLVAQLQHRFFNTANAGEEFFEHLGALSPDDTQVREVYAYCLAMGFKGKYFRPEDAPQLEEIAMANRGLLEREGTAEGIPHMFPDAYGAEKKGQRKGRLADSVFTIIIGIIPVIIFIWLFFFYNNMLQRLLASYFH